MNMLNFLLAEEIQILVRSWKKENLNFWQKMKWDTWYRKVTLPNIVSLDSGSCYSKLLHSACTEQLVLWKSINSHAETCDMAAIYSQEGKFGDIS